jgi:hypothetical protein
MAYIQLSSSDKLARSQCMITSIGTSGLLSIYSGTQPINPDITATGTLLVSMPLASVAGVASTCLQSATVVAGGSGGTNGAVTVTGTTGTGTKFQATGTITGGALAGALVVTVPGAYSVNPTSLQAEPVTGGGLTGCTLVLNMTAQMTLNAVTQTNATTTGTAGYARLTTSGGTSVIDLDVATSGSSIIINTTAMVAAGPVVVSSGVISEA